MDSMALVELIDRYKSDPESVYNTWFVGGEQRMKAFRAIRRGVRDTVDTRTRRRRHVWERFQRFAAGSRAHRHHRAEAGA